MNLPAQTPVASDADWDRIEAFMARKTVLRVGCAYCGAAPGHSCHRGGIDVATHPSRTRAAREAAA